MTRAVPTRTTGAQLPAVDTSTSTTLTEDIVRRLRAERNAGRRPEGSVALLQYVRGGAELGASTSAEVSAGSAQAVDVDGWGGGTRLGRG
jgi:hypothetical protein